MKEEQSAVINLKSSISLGFRPQGSNRVNRGGSWNNNANNCRVANRNNNTPDNSNNIGFRACLSPAHWARWMSAC